MWIGILEFNFSIYCENIFNVEFLNSQFAYIIDYYALDNINVALHHNAINAKKVFSLVLRWIPVSGAVPRFRYEKHFEIISDANLYFRKVCMHFWYKFFYKKYGFFFIMEFMKNGEIFWKKWEEHFHSYIVFRHWRIFLMAYYRSFDLTIFNIYLSCYIINLLINDFPLLSKIPFLVLAFIDALRVSLNIYLFIFIYFVFRRFTQFIICEFLLVDRNIGLIFFDWRFVKRLHYFFKQKKALFGFFIAFVYSTEFSVVFFRNQFVLKKFPRKFARVLMEYYSLFYIISFCFLIYRSWYLFFQKFGNFFSFILFFLGNLSKYIWYLPIDLPKNKIKSKKHKQRKFLKKMRFGELFVYRYIYFYFVFRPAYYKIREMIKKRYWEFDQEFFNTTYKKLFKQLIPYDVIKASFKSKAIKADRRKFAYFLFRYYYIDYKKRFLFINYRFFRRINYGVSHLKSFFLYGFNLYFIFFYVFFSCFLFIKGFIFFMRKKYMLRLYLYYYYSLYKIYLKYFFKQNIEGTNFYFVFLNIYNKYVTAQNLSFYYLKVSYLFFFRKFMFLFFCFAINRFILIFFVFFVLMFEVFSNFFLVKIVIFKILALLFSLLHTFQESLDFDYSILNNFFYLLWNKPWALLFLLSEKYNISIFDYQTFNIVHIEDWRGLENFSKNILRYELIVRHINKNPLNLLTLRLRDFKWKGKRQRWQAILFSWNDLVNLKFQIFCKHFIFFIFFFFYNVIYWFVNYFFFYLFMNDFIVDYFLIFFSYVYKLIFLFFYIIFFLVKEFSPFFLTRGGEIWGVIYSWILKNGEININVKYVIYLILVDIVNLLSSLVFKINLYLNDIISTAHWFVKTFIFDIKQWFVKFFDFYKFIYYDHSYKITKFTTWSRYYKIKNYFENKKTRYLNYLTFDKWILVNYLQGNEYLKLKESGFELFWNIRLYVILLAITGLKWFVTFNFMTIASKKFRMFTKDRDATLQTFYYWQELNYKNLNLLTNMEHFHMLKLSWTTEEEMQKLVVDNVKFKNAKKWLKKLFIKQQVRNKSLIKPNILLKMYYRDRMHLYSGRITKMFKQFLLRGIRNRYKYMKPTEELLDTVVPFNWFYTKKKFKRIETYNDENTFWNTMGTKLYSTITRGYLALFTKAQFENVIAKGYMMMTYRDKISIVDMLFLHFSMQEELFTFYLKKRQKGYDMLHNITRSWLNTAVFLRRPSRDPNWSVLNKMDKALDWLLHIDYHTNNIFYFVGSNWKRHYVKLKTVVDIEFMREEIRDKYFDYGFFVDPKQDKTEDVTWARMNVLRSLNKAYVTEGDTNYLYMKERMTHYYILRLTWFLCIGVFSFSIYSFCSNFVWRRPSKIKPFFLYWVYILYPFIKYLSIRLYVNVITTQALFLPNFIDRGIFLRANIHSVSSLIHTGYLDFVAFKFFWAVKYICSWIVKSKIDAAFTMIFPIYIELFLIFVFMFCAYVIIFNIINDLFSKKQK
jgi:hypothetical protein